MPLAKKIGHASIQTDPDTGRTLIHEYDRDTDTCSSYELDPQTGRRIPVRQIYVPVETPVVGYPGYTGSYRLTADGLGPGVLPPPEVSLAGAMGALPLILVVGLGALLLLRK